ncbi:hypothetical protein COLO4_15101 [Corchorus olitorius]|uniref:SHSP domain-containing protein n=1 Tax=Corchorus olitorius TaxID=93759 RepID=A0A1R3JPJ8_9ROSI|nr:hypothetical protein COLO4_15101 [Corchorus olitorius]
MTMYQLKSFSRWKKSHQGSMDSSSNPSESCAPERKSSRSPSPLKRRSRSRSPIRRSMSGSRSPIRRSISRSRSPSSDSSPWDDSSSPRRSPIRRIRPSSIDSSDEDFRRSRSRMDDSSDEGRRRSSFSDSSDSSDRRDHRRIRRKRRSRSSSSDYSSDEEPIAWGVMDMRSKSSGDFLRTDWRETAKEYVFEVDVPGLTKKDMSMKIKDKKLLCLRGQKRRTSMWDTTNHHSETKSGKFERRFMLCHNVDTATVKAVMKYGVLIVTLPKEAAGEVKNIPISD